jgi:hypothetical protein
VTVLQDDEHLADLHDVAGGEGERHHLAGHRRRELHQGLVGLDFDQRLVPGDGVAGSDQPGDDLALLQSLPDIREDEVDPGH